MKRRIALFFMIAFTPSVGLDAQVRPQPGTGDPRFQTVEFVSDQIVQIESAPGYQVTVELAPDEQVQSVAVGDSAAWQVSVNNARNQLFLKPLQGGVSTNMTVVTNVRLYGFDLNALADPSPSMPYSIQFFYPSPPTPTTGIVPDEAALIGRYKLSGRRALRPSSIADDGVHTYISWPEDAALPAVYLLDDAGEEALANGNMRDGVYVLDTVARQLVFRIDKHTARAQRMRLKEAR